MTGYHAFFRIASRSLAVLTSFDLQTGSNFVHWCRVTLPITRDSSLMCRVTLPIRMLVLFICRVTLSVTVLVLLGAG